MFWDVLQCCLKCTVELVLVLLISMLNGCVVSIGIQPHIQQTFTDGLPLQQSMLLAADEVNFFLMVLPS